MPSSPAVLLLGHSRPDLAREVFLRIREARPPRFYLAVDGPREPSEEAAGRAIQKLAGDVDWPCEVRMLFQTTNLGCRKAVAAAITWFFESEEEGIILEEDCVPDPTFFPYCQEALERYRGHPQVGWISGSRPWLPPAGKCHFQTWGTPWGWATWRSVWQGHDPSVDRQIADFDVPGLREWLQDGVGLRLWENRQNSVLSGKVNSWFFPWQLHLIRERKLVLMPGVNLVDNRGFGPSATHTKIAQSLPPSGAHSLPVRFPDAVSPDGAAEQWSLRGSFREMLRPAANVSDLVRELLTGGQAEIHSMIYGHDPRSRVLALLRDTVNALRGRRTPGSTVPVAENSGSIRSVVKEVLAGFVRYGHQATHAAEMMRRSAIRLSKVVDFLALQCDYPSGGRFHHIRVAYGQEGEDLILDRILKDRKTGFYVDVGAHHPFRFSNTQMLYERGWRGINIEPTAALIQRFHVWRPRDINLAVAAGEFEGECDLHVFKEGAYNTLLEDKARTLVDAGLGQKHATERVRVRPLSALLAENLPPGVTVDLLTIDVEGHDMAVLRGMDWSRCRPGLILCENLGGATDLSRAKDIPAVAFLAPLGYRLFAGTFNTLFFRFEPGTEEANKDIP